MAGVYGGITIDVEWWTSESESSPRERSIRYLQTHHTAYPSLSGSRALMDPGGREVSANGLLDTDGTLYGVVVPWRRAFTSASTFDHDSFTVECVNSSGAPEWGLTDAQHRRLGKMAREIAALNSRTVGADMIVQHKNVPGSYPTACAGPSMNDALVLQYALESNPRKGVPPMSTLFDVLDDKEDRDYLLGSTGKLQIIPNSDKAAMRLWWKGLTGQNPVAIYYGDFVKVRNQISTANPTAAGGPVTVNGPSASDIATAVLNGASARLAA